MKRISLLLSYFFCLYFSSISSAQLTDDFLKEYIPPVYKLNLLEIFPTFDQAYSKNENFKRNNVDVDFDVNFYSEKLSEKLTKTSQMRLGFDYQYNNRDGINTATGNRFYSSFSVNNLYDYYFTEKLFISAGFFGDVQNNKVTVAPSTNALSVNVSLPISVGIGRTYDITQAWHAQTILENAASIGQVIDFANTKEFADLLFTNRKARIMDSRLKNIATLENIYSFLESKGMELTPIAIASISDSYRFEAFTNRRQGYRAAIGLAPEYNYWNNELGNVSKNPGIVYFLKADYFLPINMDWQWDTNFVLEFDDAGNGVHYLLAGITSSLGWFPSQRINVRTSLSTSVRDRLSIDDNNSILMQLGTALNYYFSPALLMRTELFLRNNRFKQVNVVQNTFSEKFRCSFIYRIV